MIDVENIKQISSGFRETLEDSGFYIFCKDAAFLEDRFPRDCCDHIARLLANYFVKKYPKIKLEYAKGKTNSDIEHHWLVVENYIVDITADQFNGCDEKVIVKTESLWHYNLKEIVYSSDPEIYAFGSAGSNWKIISKAITSYQNIHDLPG